MGSFVMGYVESTCEANKALQYVFNFLPSYALGKGLVNVRATCWLATMQPYTMAMFEKHCYVGYRRLHCASA